MGAVLLHLERAVPEHGSRRTRPFLQIPFVFDGVMSAASNVREERECLPNAPINAFRLRNFQELVNEMVPEFLQGTASNAGVRVGD